MTKRKAKKTSSKRRRRSADEIARTPEYKAMLADIVTMIRAAKNRGAIRPRMTIRDLRKDAQGEGAGDAD